MKHILHAAVSTVIGGGLATITIVSALSTGITADTTVTAFTLLAVYGLLEVTLSDYAVKAAGSRMPFPRRPVEPPAGPSPLKETLANLPDAGSQWHFRWRGQKRGATRRRHAHRLSGLIGLGR
jgi:hypothetical protein